MTEIVLVAVRAREKIAARLCHDVEASHIQWDVDDSFHNGPTLNHMRALRWHLSRPHRSQYCVVLEDDAIPCPDFRRQLDMVLSEAPSALVSLYLGTGYPIQWQDILRRSVDPPDTDPHFLMAPEMLSMVGYAARFELLEAMVAYLQDRAHRFGPDKIISQLCRDRRLLVAYSRPSIVNHDDEISSAVKERFDGQDRVRARRAWKFGTRQRWDRTMARAIDAPVVARIDEHGEWYEVEKGRTWIDKT